MHEFTGENYILTAHRGKRSAEELLASLVYASTVPAIRTNLMCKAFMNYDQLQKYLSYALDAELVEEMNDHRFRITRKGSEFLKRFTEMKQCEKIAGEKRAAVLKLLPKLSRFVSPYARRNNNNRNVDSNYSGRGSQSRENFLRVKKSGPIKTDNEAEDARGSIQTESIT